MGCKTPFIKGELQVPPTYTPQNTSIENFVQVVALVQRTRPDIVDIHSAADGTPSALHGYSAASAAARADCLDGAARLHHGNVRLAHAVKTIKSVQPPDAIRPNTYGSSDIELMHVNTRWLPALSRCGFQQWQYRGASSPLLAPNSSSLSRSKDVRKAR